MSILSKEKKKKLEKQKKRSIITVLVLVSLAVLILIMNLLSSSYSWFTPKSETGKGLSFDEQYQIRSENCHVTTYRGEVVTTLNQSDHPGYKLDQVAYSSTPISNNTQIEVPAVSTVTQDSETITVPGRVYFRTEIQNDDTQYPSVVSLYHAHMPANLSVAVTYPSNTYHFVGTVSDLESYFGAGTTSWPDYFIVRNAYVKVKDQNDADGPGLLAVEWFVENRTDSPIEIDVTPNTNLYLMYN